MIKAESVQFDSESGYKSPFFSVDKFGNLIANQITLDFPVNVSRPSFEITENNGNFYWTDNLSPNPTITLERDKEYVFKLSLENLNFNLYDSDKTTFISASFQHSTQVEGIEAQGKSTGYLLLTIPKYYDQNVIYYNATGSSSFYPINIVYTTSTFATITVDTTTDSTFPDNGALTVLGGAGIQKNLSVGGDLQISTVSFLDTRITVLGQDSGVIGIIDDAGTTIPVYDTTVTTADISSSTLTESVINDSTIGLTTPSTAKFTEVTVENFPADNTKLTNKKFVSTRILAYNLFLH